MYEIKNAGFLNSNEHTHTTMKGITNSIDYGHSSVDLKKLKKWIVVDNLIISNAEEVSF